MVWTKEKAKEYMKKRYENNKEYYKEYYENNKSKINEYKKEYRENNKDIIKEKYIEYRQTEKYKKSKTISSWKFYGVKNNDFDSLYEYYLNCKFCEDCNIELVSGKYDGNYKCLDHDHTTGLFRNVVCCSCNIKRGFIDRGCIPLTKSEKNWKYRLRAFILS